MWCPQHVCGSWPHHLGPVAKPPEGGWWGRMGKGGLLALCLYQRGWDQEDARGLPLPPAFLPIA